MVQIQNSEAIEQIREAAGLSFTESLPVNLDTSKVVAVMDMTPVHKVNIIRSATRTTTGSGTIYSVPDGKEFYLLGIFVSLIKDASADTASNDPLVITATIGKISTNLCRVGVLTLTAQNIQSYIPFPQPILIDAGTNIVITGAAFTVGSVAKSGTIYAYEK